MTVLHQQLTPSFGAQTTPPDYQALLADLKKKPVNTSRVFHLSPENFDGFTSLTLSDKRLPDVKTGINAIDDQLEVANRKFSGLLTMGVRGMWDVMKSTIKGGFYGTITGGLVMACLFTLDFLGNTVLKMNNRLVSRGFPVVLLLTGGFLGSALKGAEAVRRNYGQIKITVHQNFK